MTSPLIKSVVADSNVLLSALAGGAARLVFEIDPPVEIVTTEVTIAEVEEYLPEFADRYCVDLDTLLNALAVLPVRRYSESDYISHISEARKYLQLRDPDDVHLGALALKLGLPIWSNDNDFEELPATTVYTTAKLLKILGISSR